MNFLFLLSVLLRFTLHQDNFKPARMMYSVTLAFFIMRTLQLFYVAKNTGPKIIMIRKMVSDIGTKCIAHASADLLRAPT